MTGLYLPNNYIYVIIKDRAHLCPSCYGSGLYLDDVKVSLVLPLKGGIFNGSFIEEINKL